MMLYIFNSQGIICC